MHRQHKAWRLCGVVAMVLASPHLVEADECVYVVDQAARNLIVVDTATKAVVDTVRLSLARPEDIALMGSKAYVTDLGAEYPPQSPSTVSVVDLSLGKEVSTMPVGRYPAAILAAPPGSLYVANLFDSTLSIIKDDGAIETITDVGRFPSNLTIFSGEVYVNGQSPDVAVVSMEDNRVTRHLEIGDLQSSSTVFPARDGEWNDLLVVSTSGSIVGMDAADGTPRFSFGTNGSMTTLVSDQTRGRIYGAASAEIAGEILVVDLVGRRYQSFWLEPSVHIEADVYDLALSTDGTQLFSTSVLGLYVSETATLDPAYEQIEPAGVLIVEIEAPRGVAIGKCPSDFPTSTPTATITATASGTATPTAVNTPTSTATTTPSRTITPSAVSTPTPSSSSTMTATPTEVASLTPTPTTTSTSVVMVPTATQPRTSSPTWKTSTSTSNGGCSMHHIQSSKSAPVLLVLPILLLAITRRRAFFGLALIIALIAPPQSFGTDVVPGQLIIKFDGALQMNASALVNSQTSFNAGMSEGGDDIDALNERFGVEGAHEVFFPGQGMSPAQAEETFSAGIATATSQFVSRSSRANTDTPVPHLGSIYAFNVGSGVDLVEACARYRATRHVLYCQPNWQRTVDFLPNDPLYPLSGSFGQTEHDLWGLYTLQTSRAWDISKGGGKVIAVIDTGVQRTNPDLVANIAVNNFELYGVPGVDDDENGYVDDIHGWDFVEADNEPQDENGHGTHVAGTAAAVGNNSIGMIGVAPQAKILPIRGLDRNGSGSTIQLARAIIYAALNGADVVNNSWGCGGGCPSDPLIEDAVAVAKSLGVVVVFAAGNAGRDIIDFSPENVTDESGRPIVVGASKPSSRETNFSNRGLTVSMAAPGGGETTSLTVPIEPARNILSLRASGCNTTSFCPPELVVGGQFVRQAGTSMAAPHVSGLSALILDCNRSQDFKIEDVRRVLELSGKYSTPQSATIGFGPVNATTALSFLDPPTIRIDRPTRFEDMGETMTVLGTVDSPHLRYYRIYVGEGSRPTKWRRMATKRDPVVDGVLAEFSTAELDPGLYGLRILVKARVPRQIPTSMTYYCGNNREETSLRSKYLQDVQWFIKSSPVEQITEDDGVHQYRAPSVGGNWIAAEQHVGESGQTTGILVKNILTGEERLVGGAGSKLPYIDQRYPDFMVSVAPDSAGIMQIFMNYLPANPEFRWQLSHATSGTRWSLRMDNGRVVWLDNRDGTIQVYASEGINIPAPPEVRISDGTPAERAGLVLEGDRAAWKINLIAPYVAAGIRLFDFNSQMAQVILPTSSPWSLAFSGDWIVWSNLDQTYGGFVPLTTIRAYNLVTGEEKQFTPEFGAFGNLIAKSGLVAWTKTDGVNLELQGTEIENVRVRKLMWTPESFPMYPVMSNTWLVWVDSMGGKTWQVYSLLRQ